MSEHYEIEPLSLYIGNLNQVDRNLLISFAERLGYTATARFVTKPALASENEHALTATEQLETRSYTETIDTVTFKFEDVENENDIILREHFDNLAKKDPELHSKNYARAFHVLIDSGIRTRLYTRQKNLRTARKWIQIREPDPLPGIDVVKRLDIGVDEYPSLNSHTNMNSSILAQYGMRAGSILSVLEVAKVQRLPIAPQQSQKVLDLVHVSLKSKL